MPTAEVLQPEAGDDRNKDVEIAKLNEMYYGAGSEGKLFEPDIPGFGAGYRVLEEAPQAHGGLELDRNTRVGRPLLRLVTGHQYPVRAPMVIRRTHIRRFRAFD